MSDDTKPKGPILPDGTLPNQGEISPITQKPSDAALEKKETKKDSRKVKEKKQEKQHERKQKKAKRAIGKADKAESATLTSSDELKKQQIKEYNDKTRKEKLRNKQDGRPGVKQATHRLPNNRTSAGNSATAIPVHPLTSKLRGIAPNIDSNPAENVHARPALELELANRKQKQSTPTPTATTPTLRRG
jgi:hypothetical protein